MWIASRNAGGLTPNSPNRLSCDGRTSPSFSRPDRMSSRNFEATISATRGWRKRCVATSGLLGSPLAESEPSQLVRRLRQCVDLTDAQHLVVEKQPGRRRDASLDLGPGNI